LAAAIDRRGVEREPLETLVDARYRELVASPMDGKDALTWARDTGRLVGRPLDLLDQRQEESNETGSLWQPRPREAGLIDSEGKLRPTA
jgi:hypothetical protein